MDKALKGVEKNISATERSLKDVERLLKLDPTNTELLGQKQRLLASDINDTKTKLDQLKAADKQAKAQLESGDLGQDKYDALQREIIATEQHLESLEEKAKKTSVLNANLTSFGAAASSAADKTRGLSTAAGGLLGAMAATVPTTSELRSDLSKLDNNARDAGVGIDATREAFDAFNVVSDEVDSSVEATSNLLQAGFTESNLQKAVEGLSGAYLKFPDTLKIESLADSLQETLATGTATGQFGELLDRLGIGAENFSDGLKLCTTDAEKQNYALQTLADAGLMDTYNGWVDNNKEMVDSKQATQDLNESLAKLAEVMTPLITQLTQFATKAVSAFTNLPDPVQKFLVVLLAMTAALSPVLSVVGKLSTLFGSGGLSGALTAAKAAFSGLAGVIGGISAPVLIVVGAVAALVAVFATLWKTNETFRSQVTSVWSQIQSTVQNALTTVQGIFQSFVLLVNAIWNQWGDEIMIVVQNMVSVITSILENGLSIIQNVINLVTSLINGDWKGAWNAAKAIVQSVLNIISSLVRSSFSTLASIIRSVGGSIASAVQSAFSAAISYITSLPGKAVQWGRDFIDGLVSGITGAIGKVTSAVSGIAEKITSFLHFSRPDEGPLHFYEEWMPDMMKGLAKGIYDNLPLISRAAAAVGKAINYEVMKDSPSDGINYSQLYSAVKAGASDSNTVLYIGDRPFKRVLKGMGVAFEG